LDCHPKKVAFEEIDMDKVIISGERQRSHQEIMMNAARAARGLEETLGLKLADSVAIFMRNDFGVFEMSLAAAALGAYSVPVNWHYTADEAQYVLENCGAKALIIHADLLPQIASGIPESCKVLVVETPPELSTTYQVSPEAARVPDNATGWYEWLAQFEPLAPRDVASPGAMIYTSGTTGRPKGVRRKAGTPAEMENLYATINQAFDIGPGKRTIIPAPLYHSAPNTYGILCVVMGMDETVLMPRFDPEELLRLIERHKTTHLQTVPTMFIRMLKLPKEQREKYDTSSLEFVVHAAAPCPPDVKQQMIDWWGPIINEYYGATEVGSVSFLTSEQWLNHRGSVGKAMANCEIVILDDDGKKLGAA
jgi:long-chain acyl-CoA synthetase